MPVDIIKKKLLKNRGLGPNLCKNYRPESNLPFASKLLERVVAKQLITHLDQHGLLDKFQAAYPPGHSRETALLRLVNDVLCSADGGDLVLLVLLDLSAAFDSIDHCTLLTRLHGEAGISGPAHEWFRSNLTDRTQHVMVNHYQASSAENMNASRVWCPSWVGSWTHSLFPLHNSAGPNN